MFIYSYVSWPISFLPYENGHFLYETPIINALFGSSECNMLRWLWSSSLVEAFRPVCWPLCPAPTLCLCCWTTSGSLWSPTSWLRTRAGLWIWTSCTERWPPLKSAANLEPSLSATQGTPQVQVSSTAVQIYPSVLICSSVLLQATSRTGSRYRKWFGLQQLEVSCCWSMRWWSSIIYLFFLLVESFLFCTLLFLKVYQDTVFGEGAKFISYKKVLFEMGPLYSDTVEMVSFHSVSSIGEWVQPMLYFDIKILPFKSFSPKIWFTSLSSALKQYNLCPRCGLRAGYMELINIDPGVMHYVDIMFDTDISAPVMGQLALDLMVQPPKPGDSSYDKQVTFTKMIQQICIIISAETTVLLF